MKLAEYLSGLTANERRAFCRRSKTATHYLSKIQSGVKRPGIEKCVDLERASGGAVRGEDLNPKLPWRYLAARDYRRK